MERSAPIWPASIELPNPQPLRVRADHEGFTDLHAVAVPRGQQRTRFPGGQAERLLAENMLARFRGLEGPRDMKLIGERVVDRLNRGIAQKFLI